MAGVPARVDLEGGRPTGRPDGTILTEAQPLFDVQAVPNGVYFGTCGDCHVRTGRIHRSVILNINRLLG